MLEKLPDGSWIERAEVARVHRGMSSPRMGTAHEVVRVDTRLVPDAALVSFRDPGSAARWADAFAERCNADKAAMGDAFKAALSKIAGEG